MVCHSLLMITGFISSRSTHSLRCILIVDSGDISVPEVIEQSGEQSDTNYEEDLAILQAKSTSYRNPSRYNRVYFLLNEQLEKARLSDDRVKLPFGFSDNVTASNG